MATELFVGAGFPLALSVPIHILRVRCVSITVGARILQLRMSAT
jgi:hypothetical protein